VKKKESFFSEAEQALSREFLDRGYVIREVADREALDAIRNEVAVRLAAELHEPVPEDAGRFLDTAHDHIEVQRLNIIRLAIYRGMNGVEWLRPRYFRLGRPYLEGLVGNELAMQNRVNLSIQLPHDRTSLLDIHADVFSGETPYQVVEWVPLVDVRATKSMFFLPRQKSIEVIARIRDFETEGMNALYEAVQDDLVWLDVPYGSLVIFTPNCLHGNTINEEATTRWSLNCRFTGLFTPYDSAEKSLGSFYLPITPRPVTRLGVAYRHPDAFEE
jgi:sporadic carbohydrate cluster 2OG-Fe(II) oxygenase